MQDLRLPRPAARPRLRIVALLAALLAALAYAAPALAHGGEDHAAGLSGKLAWDLATAAALLAAAAAYGTGWARLRAKGKAGAGPLLAYGAGLGALALALLSPLDALSDVLFSAHMGQHELLMLVGAPLVVAGRPEVFLRKALGERGRGTLGSALRRPGLARAARLFADPWFAALLHAGLLWAWHIPFLFEAALHDESVHALQHLGFFATAVLFWWAMVRGRYGRLGYGLAFLFVFATALHTGLLGVLLAFAGDVVYPTHAARARAAGADALADQQLAGLLMWIPAGAVTMALGLGLFLAWLGAIERRAVRRDALAARAAEVAESSRTIS